MQTTMMMRSLMMMAPNAMDDTKIKKLWIFFEIELFHHYMRTKMM